MKKKKKGNARDKVVKRDFNVLTEKGELARCEKVKIL